jgi:hypothetical protein
MQQNILKPWDLANRWGVSMATLSHWRWSGKGPHYIKIGRHISYLLKDIEEFEISKRRRSTSEFHFIQSSFSNDSSDKNKEDEQVSLKAINAKKKGR